MDDVAIVDDVGGSAMPGAAGSSAARQGQHQRAAEQAFQPVIPRVRPAAGPRAGSKPNPQAMADQPGGTV
jgi:hypothetical protein